MSPSTAAPTASTNRGDSVFRLKAAQFILDCEARREHGRLAVYRLPSADGGGTFEVAGINDRYHPKMARLLRRLIEDQAYAKAETQALHYLAQYTDAVTHWTQVPALEVFLRDCCFNRGPKGALRILQLALDVADDSKFGPVTTAGLRHAEASPNRLLLDLRSARETYERRIAPPVGARAKFWPGLVSRWDKALAFAKTLS